MFEDARDERVIAFPYSSPQVLRHAWLRCRSRRDLCRLLIPMLVQIDGTTRGVPCEFCALHEAMPPDFGG